MDDIPLKITVATVTFNAGELLARTINSVEQQTYPFVEHLIIDGNSQDNTMEAIHHYQAQNSLAEIRHEVNALSEPDDGLYDAMNKALQMATGEYILFLNAGDQFHSKDLLDHIAKAAKEGLTEGQLPAVIYGDTDIVDGQGTFLHKRPLTPPEQLSWKSFKQGMLVCHQAFFARTDLALEASYNEHYRFSADFDWCIRVMQKAKKQNLAIVNAHVVVADYLKEGMTTQHHTASLRERFWIMKQHYGFFPTLFRHIRFLVR
ncbi:MAG: glycosyltransferase family 2 protein [Bacteroidaceae bacterium]